MPSTVQRSIASQLKSRRRHQQQVFGSAGSRSRRVSFPSAARNHNSSALPITTLEFEQVKTPRRPPTAAAVVEASKEKRTEDASLQTPHVQERLASHRHRHNEKEKAPTQSPSLFLDSSDEDEAELLRPRPVFGASSKASLAESPLRDSGEPRPEQVTPAAPEEPESSPLVEKANANEPVLTTTTTPLETCAPPARTGGSAAPPETDSRTTMTKDVWSCTTCTLSNPMRVRRCAACETRRPVLDSDTTSSSTLPTESAHPDSQTSSKTSVGSETNKPRKRVRSSSRKAASKSSLPAKKTRGESHSPADATPTAVPTTMAMNVAVVAQAPSTASVDQDRRTREIIAEHPKEQAAMNDLRAENDSLRDELTKERQEIVRLQREVARLRNSQATESYEPEESRLTDPDTLRHLQVVFREYREQQAQSYQQLVNGSTHLIRSAMTNASPRATPRQKISAPLVLASPNTAPIGRYENPSAAESPPDADHRVDAFSQESSQAFALSQSHQRTPTAPQPRPPPSPANSTQTLDPAMFARSNDKSEDGVPKVFRSQEKTIQAKAPNSLVGPEKSTPMAQRSPLNRELRGLSSTSSTKGMKAPPPRATTQQSIAKSAGSEEMPIEDSHVGQVARKNPPLLNSTNSKSSAPWMSNAPSKRFMDDLEKASTARRNPTEAQGWVSSRVAKPAQKAQHTDIWADSQDADPSYKYQEVVRCKAKRQGLPCHDCPDCQAFYDCLRRSGHEFSQEFGVMEHSRHRARFTPPETPNDFWEIDFIDEKRASIEKPGNASS